MKIIEYGHQQIRCPKCRSLLQFDICDVDYSKENDSYYITCPVCAKEISVPELTVYHMAPKEAMTCPKNDN